MSLVSEYAEFTEALRRRRERVAYAAPRLLRAIGQGLGDRAMAPLHHTSQLLEEAVRDLSAAEEELRTQNEELFRARVDLEQREARFRLCFELAPVAYLLTTPDAHVRAVNGAACTLLARPANALAGKPLACFVDLAERPAFRAGLARVTGSARVEEWPIRLLGRDGVPIECRMRVRAMPAAAGTDAALAWCITEEPGSLPGPW